MPTSEQIKRFRSDPDALDFETLRKDALSLIQQLSGNYWTDYNLHDPGVTILEQLCYGLTDLSYRSEFQVPDYLAARNDAIDYEQQALYPPHEILPSSAVTESDFEKILYDAVPEIDQIWFKPFQTENDETVGLYHVYVKTDPDLLQTRALTDVAQQKHKPIIERISRLLDRLVWLCELTDQITECLRIRQNALIRWRERIRRSEQKTQTEQIELIASLITTSDVVLTKLEMQLSNLSCFHNALDSIQEILTQHPCNLEGIDKLDEQLTLLEQRFNAPLPRVEFEQILSILDSTIKKLSDLIPVLENVLPRLMVSLSEIVVFLHDRIDCLKNVKRQLMVFYETEIKKKILAIYAANRCLGEDIHCIEIIETKPFFLVGEIEIHPAQNPARVYAEIFFKCARYISSSIEIEHYGTVLTGNKNYEQVFLGPLTQHGYIRDESLEVHRSTVTTMDLMTLIRKVNGVVKIQNFNLLDEKGRRYTNLDYQLSQYHFPALHFSDAVSTAQLLHLTLPHGNIEHTDPNQFFFNENIKTKVAAFFDEFRRELKKLTFEYHAFRRNSQTLTQFIPLPQGQSRHFSHYYSIQNHFPAIYGINRYGIPRSEPLETQAKVKQLKAYLYPFEQLMANYLQGLQEIPELFSANSASGKTYFSQFLDNSSIPEIETLYTEAHNPSAINNILCRYDDFYTRKNRILDILLALYGVVFDQRKLKRFNFYHHEDADNWLIENKINYLKLIREISKNKGKGFDYLQPSLTASSDARQENSVGLHAKISLLLGLKHDQKPGGITAVLSAKNSRLVSDQIMARKVKFISEKKPSEAVPPIPDFKPSDVAIPSRLPVFSDSIFKEGIKLESYRLVRSGQEETKICFKSGQDTGLWILTKKSTFDDAVIYAHQFCSTLTQLNEACENFYLIEHILLRPRGQEAFSQSAVAVAPDPAFFHYRVSFVFPSWTARFSDIEYRKFVRQTVQKNLPAHLFADFYWLDFSPLQDFEECYKTWLSFLHQLNQDDETQIFSQLDQASEKIISFLMEYKQEIDRDYWL